MEQQRQQRTVDEDDLVANDINRFDLVVSNLYPFRETVADEGATESDIIEKIGAMLKRIMAPVYLFVSWTKLSY